MTPSVIWHQLSGSANTGNLDSQSEQQILDLFETLHADGLTISVVTHSQVVAERASIQLSLRDGKLL